MKLVGLFLLNIALVKAHGGLTYPYGWWDTKKIGYENNHGRDWGFTAMGCGQNVSAKDTQNRLNNKCFYNVSILEYSMKSTELVMSMIFFSVL